VLETLRGPISKGERKVGNRRGEEKERGKGR